MRISCFGPRLAVLRRHENVAAGIHLAVLLRGTDAAARQSRNRMEKDRIMAGQNHIGQNHQWQNPAAPPFMVLPAMILSLLRMILSGHDSVGLLRWHKKSPQLANKWVYCSAGISGQGPYPTRPESVIFGIVFDRR
jgi:hypothetical protein